MTRLRIRDLLADAALGLLSNAVLWHRRARQRRQLLELSAQRLDDIGVDAVSARREVAKPFWRA